MESIIDSMDPLYCNPGLRMNRFPDGSHAVSADFIVIHGGRRVVFVMTV